MPALPEAVKFSWEKHHGPFLFATSDSDGNSNVIYVTCVNRFRDDTVVIADNKYSKTGDIKAGSGGLIALRGR